MERSLKIIKDAYPNDFQWEQDHKTQAHQENLVKGENFYISDLLELIKFLGKSAKMLLTEKVCLSTQNF